MDRPLGRHRQQSGRRHHGCAPLRVNTAGRPPRRPPPPLHPIDAASSPAARRTRPRAVDTGHSLLAPTTHTPSPDEGRARGGSRASPPDRRHSCNEPATPRFRPTPSRPPPSRKGNGGRGIGFDRRRRAISHNAFAPGRAVYGTGSSSTNRRREPSRGGAPVSRTTTNSGEITDMAPWTNDVVQRSPHERRARLPERLRELSEFYPCRGALPSRRGRWDRPGARGRG